MLTTYCRHYSSVSTCLSEVCPNGLCIWCSGSTWLTIFNPRRAIVGKRDDKNEGCRHRIATFSCNTSCGRSIFHLHNCSSRPTSTSLTPSKKTNKPFCFRYARSAIKVRFGTQDYEHVSSITPPPQRQYGHAV